MVASFEEVVAGVNDVDTTPQQGAVAPGVDEALNFWGSRANIIAAANLLKAVGPPKQFLGPEVTGVLHHHPEQARGVAPQLSAMAEFLHDFAETLSEAADTLATGG